jgi:hypothetical protein
MATLLDPVRTRLAAIIAGTYPVGSPYIPAGTFTERQIALPQSNPSFPGGSQSAALNRAFDLAWPTSDFDPAGVENGSQGPFVRAQIFELRVQYAVQLPPALSPLPTELALGAMEVASRRAQDDAARIVWALLQPGAWTGAAIGLLRLEPVTVAKADRIRAFATLRGVIGVSMSAATAPDLWSP